MPHMDHTGPEGKGPKTGRKLGKCRLTEAEKKEQGNLGTGQAKRRNEGNGEGKGKRLQHDTKR